MVATSCVLSCGMTCWNGPGVLQLSFVMTKFSGIYRFHGYWFNAMKILDSRIRVSLLAKGNGSASLWVATFGNAAHRKILYDSISLY